MSVMSHEEICSAVMDGLRLRSTPLALKLFESEEEMNAVKGLRRPKPGVHFTMCQLIGQARWLNQTLGIALENTVDGGNCGGVMGLNAPSDKYLNGTMFHDVWFATIEASQKHQEQMPRVQSGKYRGVVASPLSKGRLENPDTVLIYATPGQMIILINALQHKTYKRYDFTVTGETACADSWGRGLKTGEPSISIPCFAERRFGGVQDDELLIALRIEDLEEVARGIEWLSKRGIRYPIPPYSVQNDPAAAFEVNYAGKL